MRRQGGTVERTDSGGRPPARGWSPGPALGAFYDGVSVICQLSAQFSDAGWLAPSRARNGG